MAKIALLIEYEGTRYHGFQIQLNVPTIQGELERAIFKVTGEAVRLHGAGRTDAGVHARGQVATFETASALPPLTFLRALNFYLPPDISVRDACNVGMGFDVRRDALSREYRYTILNDSVYSPRHRRWAYRVTGKLDAEAMNRACEVLLGQHDFAPFTNSEGGAKNTVRTVFKAEVRREGRLMFFDMVANAFLPQQVRRTAGSLLRIGSGDMEVDEFREMAGSGLIGAAKPVAPAHGLCLMRVNYSNIGFTDYENI
ncbi:tRNA pseudouridine(38-40) synthase TruA [Dehalococcoidia bacterium]|nr:tRNA pseudouridine(38-40) synthase TruA [Dehalococcoidia bacterium]MCL0097156.1 tRNA pseudouridine(38-40) synthase TruA [Dehalococcoidia bacterium]